MAWKLCFFFNRLAAGLSVLVNNQSLSHIFFATTCPQSLSSNFCISYLICMLCWHWGVSRACKKTGASYSQTLCFCFWALTLRSSRCWKIPEMAWYRRTLFHSPKTHRTSWRNLPSIEGEDAFFSMFFTLTWARMGDKKAKRHIG